MKIQLSSFCHKCLEEDGDTKEAYDKLIKENRGKEHFQTEFNDENLYEFTCSRGHKSYFQLSEEKFELLFDLGALALIDGYAKEAVSTFASAYERFIEYYIKVICMSKNVPFENFIKTWKTMIKQSERQLGAFYFLQLIETGSTNFILDEKWVNFRNRVIHQGYIPKSSEAIAYGEYLLTNIDLILHELKAKHEKTMRNVTLLRISENGTKINENVRMTTSKMPTIVSSRNIWKDNVGKINFRKALESIKTNGFYNHFYVKGI